MSRGRGTYVLPRHPSEADRLDIQHFAFRAVVKGNYLAPMVRPARILDVGCGTGRWAYEVCAEFPDAAVVGLDLVHIHGNLQPPGNYRFVRGNVLEGLPFAGRRFDMVHQRLLVSGVPLRSWPTVVAELIRVTRPGGWVELVESMPNLDPEGPATRRLWDLLRQLGRTVGHDTLGQVASSLGRYLSMLGIEEVQVRTFTLPIGDWGGQVGTWMACGYRSLFTRLIDRLQVLGLPESECRALIEAMLEEFERFQATISFKIAWGRRPGVQRPRPAATTSAQPP